MYASSTSAGRKCLILILLVLSLPYLAGCGPAATQPPATEAPTSLPAETPTAAATETPRRSLRRVRGKDQRAIIGPAGPDGFFLDCGFSGTGFKTAPAVGASLAEWIVDGRPSTVDLSVFRLERFAEGQPLRGRYAYENAWR